MAATCAEAQPPLGPQADVPFQGGAPTLWIIPEEVVYTDNGVMPVAVQDGIPLYQPYNDQFSWRMFIAINWPAKPDGKPDERRWIGAGGDAQTVWEHWMNADDVFREGGSEPPPWGTPTPVPATCKGLSPGPKLVFTREDESEVTHNGVQLGPAYAQVQDTGPLIDQHRRWVRFEVYLNDVAYDYIRKNKLYSAAGQKEFKAKPGSTIDFPAGSIEVKAAWMILDKNDNEKLFHRATGVFVKADGSCVEAAVGLVAQHVVAKTKRTPTRLWGTFEHDRALCRRSEYGDNPVLSGAFCSRECLKDPTAAGCAAPNTSAPKPWVPPADPTQPGEAPPSQVVRVTPIPVAVGQLNSLIGSFLGSIDSASVWPNYDLVTTQWVMPLASDLNTSGYRQWLKHPGMGPAPQYVPRIAGEQPCNDAGGGTPTQPCPGLIVPAILASTLIETYIQPGSSCIGCHEAAVTTASQPADGSWVLARAR